LAFLSIGENKSHEHLAAKNNSLKSMNLIETHFNVAHQNFGPSVHLSEPGRLAAAGEKIKRKNLRMRLTHSGGFRQLIILTTDCKAQ
jgi:hypothetical protein